eukprot:366351-Chlamydomonas_euryale.AAC.10
MDATSQRSARRAQVYMAFLPSTIDSASGSDKLPNLVMHIGASEDGRRARPLSSRRCCSRG